MIETFFRGSTIIKLLMLTLLCGQAVSAQKSARKFVFADEGAVLSCRFRDREVGASNPLGSELLQRNSRRVCRVQQMLHAIE